MLPLRRTETTWVCLVYRAAFFQLCFYPHIFIYIHPIQSCIKLQVFLVSLLILAKLALHNTRKWLWNLSQHPPSRWIPCGSSGHCWECFAQHPQLFSCPCIFHSLTLTTFSFVHLLSPQFICVSTSSWSLCSVSHSLLFGGKQWERRCLLSLAKGRWLYLREGIMRRVNNSGSLGKNIRTGKSYKKHFPAILSKLLAGYGSRTFWL